jgi:hypothetical protein
MAQCLEHENGRGDFIHLLLRSSYHPYLNLQKKKWTCERVKIARFERPVQLYTTVHRMWLKPFIN